jgi:hypothetical protein
MGGRTELGPTATANMGPRSVSVPGGDKEWVSAAQEFPRGKWTLDVVGGMPVGKRHSVWGGWRGAWRCCGIQKGTGLKAGQGMALDLGKTSSEISEDGKEPGAGDSRL